MKSVRIQVFLSCSFDPKDRDVVDFFTSICHGVDLHCVNVDKCYISTPPRKARELIDDSHAFIAIATRKDEVKSGVFSISKAIDQEIAMAYAIKKPILLFVEDGVDTATGFFHNYGTYQEFTREMLTSPIFLEKAVASIHGMKMDVIEPHELELAQQCPKQKFQESAKCLIELVDLSGSFTWRRSHTSRTIFTSRYSDGLKVGTWADVPVKGEGPSSVLKWSYNIDYSTKPFRLTPIVEEHTFNRCRISFDINPIPVKNDVIELSTIFESPYINPIYWEDLKEPNTQIIINGVSYACYDGHYLSVLAQDLKIQFRFPASIGLKVKDLAPFVRSYTGKIDYMHESEMERLSITSDYYAGSVFIEISVKNPLLHHLYGVAWNPPKKP